LTVQKSPLSVIVLPFYDDGCCSDILSTSDISYLDAADNSPYPFDPYGGGETMGGQCYSVVVYAKCPDGSISQASNSIVSFPDQ
jgi:hypothetical protein